MRRTRGHSAERNEPYSRRSHGGIEVVLNLRVRARSGNGEERPRPEPWRAENCAAQFAGSMTLQRPWNTLLDACDPLSLKKRNVIDRFLNLQQWPQSRFGKHIHIHKPTCKSLRDHARPAGPNSSLSTAPRNRHDPHHSESMSQSDSTGRKNDNNTYQILSSQLYRTFKLSVFYNK